MVDRQLVLKYHPDKQTVSGGEVPNTENAFACIKIGGLTLAAVGMLLVVTPPLPHPCSAYDILSDPKTRMSFDSADPLNDDSVPPNSAHSKENFFDVFGPVFESNSKCVT